MQSQTIYRWAQPTSLQPPASSDWPGVPGWAPADRIVVYIGTNEVEEIRQGCVRGCGILNLGVNHQALSPANKILFDPVTGANGFFKSIITELDFGNGLQTVENLQEYPRSVHDFNELYSDGNMNSMADALQEGMCGANDNTTIDDYRQTVPLGVKFGTVTNASQVPFSIDLKTCVNSATLSGNKIKGIQISFILEDAFKTGCLSLASGGAVQFDYRISDFEIRYIADPLAYKGDVVLKVVNNSSTPYVLNRISGISFQTASPTKSVFCTFIRNDHNSSSTQLQYNYLQNEALPQIASLELKVNQMNDAWQYPLTQTAQYLYHYLLALNNGEYPKTHSLSYAKLDNTLPAGFGIGASLTRQYPPQTNINFNIVLQNALDAGISYRVFFYCVGEIVI